MDFKINCLNCGHETSKELPYDYKDINIVIKLFFCSKCRSKEIELYSLNGDLIYTSKHVVLCEDCENPIIEPRLKCVPDTKLCVLCQTGETIKNKINELEQEMLSTSTCPWCGSFLIKRINSYTGEPFLGCSDYPHCTYTDNYDESLLNNWISLKKKIKTHTYG